MLLRTILSIITKVRFSAPVTIFELIVGSVSGNYLTSFEVFYSNYDYESSTSTLLMEISRSIVIMILTVYKVNYSILAY